jgi:hypothetical protein
MTRLLFGPDGRLRDGKRTLAFVAADERADALGKLVADDVEAAIVTPAGAAGWRFDLLDERGQRIGGFRPFRLRRGGRLRSGELTVALQGDSGSHARWSFATRDGDCVEATVGGPGERTATGSGEFEIALRSGRPDVESEHALTLAFGCWLIAQWHAIAPGDHMLTSEGPADELASTLRPLRSGGISERDAN